MADYWRDHLRQASFRGVTFEVESREGQGGRTLAKHRYPGRDEGYDEDIGGKPLAFSLSAYLIGPGYLAAKDALIAALREKGPGELVDQWGDSRQVQVDGFSWSEDSQRGGFVSFSIQFAEWSPVGVHTIDTDTAHAVALAATPARAALIDVFEADYSVRGNAFVLADAIATVQDYAQRLQSVLDVDNAVVFQASAAVVAAKDQIEAFVDDIVETMAEPSALALRLVDRLDATLGCLDAGWPRYAAATVLQAYGDDFGTIVATTTSLRQAAVNRARMIALVRGSAAIAAAVAATEIDFAVYDDAVAVRQTIADTLDALMLVADDAVYARLAALRAAAVRDIGERGANLARLTDVTPSATLPAMVLAYRLFGDAGREADVVDRNPTIRHPGFVSGGLTLKVPNA